jgi:hypothetical protein
VEAFRFDFASHSQPAEGRLEVALVAAENAELNGIAHWIRLELDTDTVLQVRRDPEAIFFIPLLLAPARAGVHATR